MIRLPPDAPNAVLAPEAWCTITGHMLDNGLLPGAIEFERPGLGSNHMPPLFIKMPVFGSTTLEPKRDSRV